MTDDSVPPPCATTSWEQVGGRGGRGGGGGGGGAGDGDGGNGGGAEGGAHVPKHSTMYSTSNSPRVAVVTSS